MRVVAEIHQGAAGTRNRECKLCWVDRSATI
ncbi:MAG: hypothetical protein H6R26_373, partial [Proteobacteria bacterium]|nr:hypothetical protein [Pseudomonadota bacterium]